MQHIYSAIQSFISLVYPMQCIVCSGEVLIDNSAICPICLDELPYTYFEQSNTDHPMDRMFYGRLSPQFTYALLFFESLEFVPLAILFPNRHEPPLLRR